MERRRFWLVAILIVWLCGFNGAGDRTTPEAQASGRGQTPPKVILAQKKAERSMAAQYLYELGEVYFKQGIYQEAINYFKKVLLIEPGDKEAECYIHQIKNMMVAPKEIVVEKEITREERGVEIGAGVVEKAKEAEFLSQRVKECYRRGKGYYRKGQYKEAIEQFRRVLVLEPGHAGALSYLKRVQKRMERVAKAKARAQRISIEEAKRAEREAEREARAIREEARLQAQKEREAKLKEREKRLREEEIERLKRQIEEEKAQLRAQVKKEALALEETVESQIEQIEEEETRLKALLKSYQETEASQRRLKKKAEARLALKRKERLKARERRIGEEEAELKARLKEERIATRAQLEDELERKLSSLLEEKEVAFINQLEEYKRTVQKRESPSMVRLRGERIKLQAQLKNLQEEKERIKEQREGLRERLIKESQRRQKQIDENIRKEEARLKLEFEQQKENLRARLERELEKRLQSQLKESKRKLNSQLQKKWEAKFQKKIRERQSQLQTRLKEIERKENQRPTVETQLERERPQLRSQLEKELETKVKYQLQDIKRELRLEVERLGEVAFYDEEDLLSKEKFRLQSQLRNKAEAQLAAQLKRIEKQLRDELQIELQSRLKALLKEKEQELKAQQEEFRKANEKKRVKLYRQFEDEKERLRLQLEEERESQLMAQLEGIEEELRAELKKELEKEFQRQIKQSEQRYTNLKAELEEFKRKEESALGSLRVEVKEEDEELKVRLADFNEQIEKQEKLMREIEKELVNEEKRQQRQKEENVRKEEARLRRGLERQKAQLGLELQKEIEANFQALVESKEASLKAKIGAILKEEEEKERLASELEEESLQEIVRKLGEIQQQRAQAQYGLTVLDGLRRELEAKGLEVREREVKRFLRELEERMAEELKLAEERVKVRVELFEEKPELELPEEERIRAHFGRGKLFYEEGDYPASIIEFRKVWGLDAHHPLVPRAFEYIETAYTKIQEAKRLEEERKKVEVAEVPKPEVPKELIEEEKAIEEVEVKGVEELIRQAKIDLKKRRYGGAIKKCELVLAEDPENYEAANILYKAKLGRIKQEEKKIEMEKALSEKEMMLEIEKRGRLPTKRKEVEEEEEEEKITPLVPVPEVRKRLKESVTVNFKDVELAYCLNFLTDLTGVNIIPSSSELAKEKKVTIKIKDMPLEDALRYILKAQGLTYRIEEDAVWVASPEEMENESPKTRVYFLNQGTGLFAEFGQSAGGGEGVLGGAAQVSKVITIKDTLEDAVSWPAGSKLVLDERTGALVITNTPSNLQTIENILYNLDVTPIQVLIEARFVKVVVTDIKELGIDWKLTGTEGFMIERKGDGGRYEIMPGAGVDLDVDTAASAWRWGEALGLTFVGVLSHPEFEVVLHALAETEKAKTLSCPRVTTLNNQPATARIVDEFIYPTRYETQMVQYDITGDGDYDDSGETEYKVVPIDFVSRDVGIILNVTPSVGKDRKTITLTLVPEVSSHTGTYYEEGGAKIPKFESSSVSTSVVINDGETVVLGGLITEEEVKSTSKVPLLGDIPLLGKLFRKDRTRVEKSNLIIFVTATLQPPTGEFVSH